MQDVCLDFVFKSIVTLDLLNIFYFIESSGNFYFKNRTPLFCSPFILLTFSFTHLFFGSYHLPTGHLVNQTRLDQVRTVSVWSINIPELGCGMIYHVTDTSHTYVNVHMVSQMCCQ